VVLSRHQHLRLAVEDNTAPACDELVLIPVAETCGTIYRLCLSLSDSLPVFLGTDDARVCISFSQSLHLTIISFTK
jgi:hypothetical protein